ncbi:hypothetical protein ACFLYL_00830 [Chloroflexota bacterium]
MEKTRIFETHKQGFMEDMKRISVEMENNLITQASREMEENDPTELLAALPPIILKIHAIESRTFDTLNSIVLVE